MLHAKFHGNRPTGSGEEDFDRIYNIWACRPSWSCDKDFREQNINATLQLRFHIKFQVDYPIGFREEDLCNCDLILIFQ